MATRSLTYSTGYTLKTVVRDFSTGAERLWNTNTSAFEAYNASNIAYYGITTTEGSPGNYTWMVPALAASASGCEYQAITYQIAGSTLATTDLPNSVWLSTFLWSGTAEVSAIDIKKQTDKLTFDANGMLMADIEDIGGNPVSCGLIGGFAYMDVSTAFWNPFTLGRSDYRQVVLDANHLPSVGVGAINNILTTSIESLGEYFGTSQPINFTGTGASAVVKGDGDSPLFSGAISAGSATTVTLVSGSSNAGSYVNATILLTSGTGAGQQATVAAYNPITGVLAIANGPGTSGAWAVTPDNTTGVKIVGSSAGADFDLPASIDPAGGADTLRKAMRLILAATAGKLSGAAGTTITIQDTSAAKNRIVATVDANGDRTSLTYDVT